MIRREIVSKKQQIISEYLTGSATLVALSEKYGVNARTIQSWVRSFRKQESVLPSAEPEDVKALKKELAQAKLKNELLEEMLRLSEEHAGIDFRKKFGSGQ
jgi:transposase-like protein